MSDITFKVMQWPEDVMQNYVWLDEHLQQQPATVKEFQPKWQAYKYLLNGKMYAYIGVDDRNGRPIITLKLEPEYSDTLRMVYEDIVPGYYMNKVHWSTAYLDGEIPREVLTDMACAAHQLVLSSLTKKARREILGT